MTPVERLEAAIAKLEQLRADASQVAWRSGAAHSIHGASYKRDNLTMVSTVTGYAVAHYVSPADADLIVTLHRSIDAQLAILRFAAVGLYDLPEFVALADAILGGVS